MFGDCLQCYMNENRLENQPTAKGNWPTHVNSKRYWTRPTVGVLARNCCISQKNQAGFEQMLKLLMNLLMSSMVNIFPWSGGRGEGFQSFHYHQMKKIPSFIRTYSILAALFRPFNVQDFTWTPPASSNQLHKCHKKCSPEYFLCPPPPPPPLPPPNYTQDLGSLLLFSSLWESIDFVGCYATRPKDGI